MKLLKLLIVLLLLAAAPMPLEAQVSEIYSFTNLNQAIPDGKAYGLSDVRTITSAISNLTSVRLNLRLVGEFNGDLYGYVRHIRGTTTNFCVLLNRVGRTAANAAGYADAGLNIVFDDNASLGDIHQYRAVTNLPAGTALTGSWQPDGREADPAVVTENCARTTQLGSFANCDGSGEWTLYLADLELGGTNMLASWELQLTGATAPPLSWPVPADIVYGTALSALQLNASSPVPGTFVYSPPLGTQLNAGNQQVLTATFNPTDTASYASVTTHVTLNVLKASAMGLLNTSLNPALPGETVVLTYAIHAVAPGSGTPTGTVQFRINGASAGGPASLSAGTATLSTSALIHGSNAVMALYAGDSNFNGITNTLTPVLLINTPPVADRITLSRNPGQGIKIAIAALLANAVDADNDPLTLVNVSATSAHGGTLAILTNWIFYTPASGLTNADSFTYTVSDGFSAPLTGTVTVNVVADNSFSPNVSITNLVNGSYHIRGNGIPGRTYHIEYCQDLNKPSWQSLGTATADSAGVFVFVDASSTLQRYYRSVYP
jgi:subtilisin-like proprotein convertase family protein